METQNGNDTARGATNRAMLKKRRKKPPMSTREPEQKVQIESKSVELGDLRASDSPVSKLALLPYKSAIEEKKIGGFPQTAKKPTLAKVRTDSNLGDSDSLREAPVFSFV